MAPMSIPQQPLEVDEPMKAAIAGAFDSRNFITVGYIGPDGYPHLSRRGTVQPFGPQQLALWVRKREDGLAKAIADHPQLTLFYIDLAGGPQLYTFYGRASVSSDPAVAEQVFTNSPEREQGQDPERQGVPIIVDLERVEALGARTFLMVR